MAGAGLHTTQLVVVLLLLLVGFGALARRLGVPYPIVLVLGGLLVSLVPGLPRPVLDPEVVFLIFLPPLLYAGAWNASWRELSRSLPEIASLALGLVVVTVAGVGLAAGFVLPGFDARAGFVLGAVVSTTDAIAATTIARRMQLPRPVVDLLEGESLVNDASGLLALEFGLLLLASGAAPPAWYGLFRLGYLVVVGVAIGLVLGVVVTGLEHLIDDGPIEIAISLAVPYAAYLLADAVHASGVLAVVAAGLYVSRRSTRFFSPAVRIQAYAVWDALTFILNGFVFLLVGLQLPLVFGPASRMGLWPLVAAGAIVSAIVIALRLLGVFPALALAAVVRRRPGGRARLPLPPRQAFVVGWAGMRGVIALAAALAVPRTVAGGQPFPQRDEIVFLTFCVILATLVLQGLSLPPLIRGLGLAGAAEPDCEEPEARRLMLEAALARLEELRADAGGRADLAAVHDDLAEHYRQRLAAARARLSSGVGPPRRGAHPRREVVRELLRVERETAIRLRDEHRISDDVLRQLEHELDLSEARLSARAR